MTDIAKALTFTKHCLKWADARASQPAGIYIEDLTARQTLELNSAADLERVLQEFLGSRYFIQINRGTSSLFHWRVIVGVQDRSAKGASLGNAQAEGEDLWDCIFDACISATRI